MNDKNLRDLVARAHALAHPGCSFESALESARKMGALDPLRSLAKLYGVDKLSGVDVESAAPVAPEVAAAADVKRRIAAHDACRELGTDFPTAVSYARKFGAQQPETTLEKLASQRRR